jgi:hypothetical protein
MSTGIIDFGSTTLRSDEIVADTHVKIGATAALQEVDRQQQADKLRIAELETQLASVLARLDALENPS